jgi:uncharacterized protein (DUF2267 family)
MAGPGPRTGLLDLMMWRQPPPATIRWHRTLAGEPAKGVMAMDQKVLIRSVAERSALSREESADITRAVLEGLAGQLGEGEAKRLTLDLPDPMTEQLRAPRRRRHGAHPIEVTEFIRQVAERTGLTENEARAGTAAVLAALRESMSPEDYSHLMGQLPSGYAALAEPPG